MYSTLGLRSLALFSWDSLHKLVIYMSGRTTSNNLDFNQGQQPMIKVKKRINEVVSKATEWRITSNNGSEPACTCTHTANCIEWRLGALGKRALPELEQERAFWKSYV